jgi:hypothetical protein
MDRDVAQTQLALAEMRASAAARRGYIRPLGTRPRVPAEWKDVTAQGAMRAIVGKSVSRPNGRGGR